MPLLLAARYRRALAFSARYATANARQLDHRRFWSEFLTLFDGDLRQSAQFDVLVCKADGAERLLSLVVPGKLMVEPRRPGVALSRATTDHCHYFPHLTPAQRPRGVLVTDLAHFRLYDLLTGDDRTFALAELPLCLEWFRWLNPPAPPRLAPHHPANTAALHGLTALYRGLRADNSGPYYTQAQALRLACLFFAHDAGLLNARWLPDLLAAAPADLGLRLKQLCEILRLPTDERPPAPSTAWKGLPQLNHSLFHKKAAPLAFSEATRARLDQAAAPAWRRVQPAVLGLLLQGLFEPGRASLFEPTAESRANALKVINPLLMDDLRRQLADAGTDRDRLETLHQHLTTITIFDPCCSCGTLLVLAYRELRLLEIALLTRLLAPAFGPGQPANLAPHARVQLSQVHGIDHERIAVDVAETTLWMADQQLNLQLAAVFGTTCGPLPLRRKPRLVWDEALTLDWATVCPPTRHLFILSNPPTTTPARMGPYQRLLLHEVASPVVAQAHLLNLGAGYFLKAAQYLQGTGGQAAFITPHALMQGEQGRVLWGQLLGPYGMHIRFAHRNFLWLSRTEALPPVYCAVVGFGPQAGPSRLFHYNTPDGVARELPAARINAYLVRAALPVLAYRAAPLSGAPPVQVGSTPGDGSHLLLTASEKDALLAAEPAAAPFVRPYLSAETYGVPTTGWCLWPAAVPPAAWPALPLVRQRVAQVARLRGSHPLLLRHHGIAPTHWAEDRQPTTAYVLLPRLLEGGSGHVPVGLWPATTVASRHCLLLPDATGYWFGMLSSTMYRVWVRQVAERRPNDYYCTVQLVFNNFPFPPAPTPDQRRAVEAAAAAVLAARAQCQLLPLTRQYRVSTMPPALTLVYRHLDAAVDACYSPIAFITDLSRLEFLFDLHQHLVGPPAP